MQKPTKEQIDNFFKVAEWLENKYEYEPEFQHCYNCIHSEVCSKKAYLDLQSDMKRKRFIGFIQARSCSSYKLNELCKKK